MKKLLVFVILFSVYSHAMTWDEPWQEEIISNSEYLILGSVVKSSDSLISVQVINSFGEELIGTIDVDGFFMLDICSSSGGNPKFNIAKGKKGYFFLKKGKNGNFKLPTPTSGFDRIVEDKVHATYRHTYHQAALNLAIYEKTYRYIWNTFHGTQKQTAEIKSFIDSLTQLEPAGFDDDEIETFYNQHAALETAFLCKMKLDFERAKKFADSDNFHAQVSGLRVMKYIDTEPAKDYLIEFIKNPENDNFSVVIAIRSLWHQADYEIRSTLWQQRDLLSNEDSGFESNLMDPRVCTYFPSPRMAVHDLMKKKD